MSDGKGGPVNVPSAGHVDCRVPIGGVSVRAVFAVSRLISTGQCSSEVLLILLFL